jgi:hypothetical protein
MPAYSNLGNEVLVRAPGQNLSSRPVRPPACAPPVTPTPIRGWRRCPVTPRQAFLLKTTGKGVGAGVKAVTGACRLVLTPELLGGNTGGQGQGQGHSANHPCELQPSRRHPRGPPWARLISGGISPGPHDMPQVDWQDSSGGSPNQKCLPHKTASTTTKIDSTAPIIDVYESADRQRAGEGAEAV